MRELETKGEIATEVANRAPATLKDALAVYAEVREREVSRALWDLDATSEFKARDITYQIAALAEIQRAVVGEPDEAPKKKAKKAPQPANVVSLVPAARSHRQLQIDLASVLRASEKATVYGEPLGTLKDEAKAQIVQHTNVRANQAMGSEIDELWRFLQRVEDGAQRAQAEIIRETQRGGNLRDPRQVGGARMSM